VNLLKSPLRRTTAVLVGAFIGMAGAVAIAAPASAHSPVVKGSTTCVKDGSWTIDWAVGNDYGTDATVAQLKLDPSDATITGPVTKKQPNGKNAKIPANSAGNVGDQIHGSTTVTDKVGAVTLYVWLHWRDYTTPNDKPAKFTVNKPDLCAPSSPPPTTTPPTQPGQPTPILSQDCTTITVGLSNPANGKEFTLEFKTSKGEQRSDVVKPGKSASEMFSAVPGFTVTRSIKGVEGSSVTIEYKKPGNCDTAGGGGGSGGPLPVTGSAASSIAGGAAVLLIAGGVLFFVARRRRVKFTA
jgi:LPXTG-motif cell wall-anchored protein